MSRKIVITLNVEDAALGERPELFLSSQRIGQVLADALGEFLEIRGLPHSGLDKAALQAQVVEYVKARYTDLPPEFRESKVAEVRNRARLAIALLSGLPACGVDIR